MKYFILKITIVSIFVSFLAASCKPAEDDDGLGLLLLLGLLNNRGPMYNGFAEIPDSVKKPAANTSSTATSTNGLTVLNDPTLEGITNAFNPIRDVVKENRDLVYAIGTLIQVLKAYDPSGSASPIVGTTSNWGGQPGVIRYQSSTAYGEGTRKLEVWWSDAAEAPYTSTKALELVFLDTNPEGSDPTTDIKGHVWAKFLNEYMGVPAFGNLYVKFEALHSTTRNKRMAVAIQGWGENGIDNAHFYVLEDGTSGITTLDGTFTVNDFTDINSKTTDRAYVFSGAGSDELGRAVVRAAFPSAGSSNTAPYTGDVDGSIADLYSRMILYNLSQEAVTNCGAATTALACINLVYGVVEGIGACNGTNLTAPIPPVTEAGDYTGGTTAAGFLACLDGIKIADPTVFNTSIAPHYYIPNIQNDAYYKLLNGNASLEGVGTYNISADSAYINVKAAADTVNTVRNAVDPFYGNGIDTVDFTPLTVSTLNVVTGIGLPTEAQWTTAGDTVPAVP